MLSLPKKLGLSLLEVILAFTLFVTVMVLMMSVWVAHARAVDLSQNREVAAALAQMFMEQALNQGYAAANVTSTPFTVERRLRGNLEYSTFNYAVNVSYPAPGLPPPPPAHKVVVVSVSWHDSTGDHTLRMESNASW